MTPKPPQQFEARVVIWDTLDLISGDFDGCTDGYARAYIGDSNKAKETDTHYRCQDGKCSFNYRLLFPLTLPMPPQD